MRMVERVARALLADRHPELRWEDATELQRNDYAGHARTAIEALREPTDAMLDAWADELARQHVALDEFSEPIFPQKLHRAMIDAVLAEDKQ